MLRKETCIAVLAALAAAGCQPANDKNPVLARVGSEKITQADVDAELKMNGVKQTDDPKVRRAALEQIINRELFAREARERGLTNNAQAQAIREATVETFEASLARAALAAEAKKPTPEEVASYIQAHPEKFADRRVYLVERLRAQGQPDAAVLEALKPTQTLEAAEAVLRDRKIPYRRTLDELDTLRAATEVARSLGALRPGEPFVLPEPGGFSVGRVRQQQARPLDGGEAKTVAAAILIAERQGKAIAERLRALRAEKVTYEAAAPKAK